MRMNSIHATGIVAALWHTAAPAIAKTPFTAGQLGTTVCNGTVTSMYPTHMVIACRHREQLAGFRIEWCNSESK
jgi:hypothetical protein